MSAQRDIEDCKVAIFGVPYDGTTSFKPGARFGPSSIREVSHGIETYCPQLDFDLEELKYADIGSLEIPMGAPQPVIQCVEQATRALLEKNIKPLILGGEHSITPGAISAVVHKYPELIIVQLDAHADLRNEWLGNKYNHACSMQRCLEILPSQRLFQVAIRSGTKEEFNEMQKTNRLIKTTKDRNFNDLKNALQPYLGYPLYLTFDLDWYDPSVMPGTGTPEPGGYTWQDFANIVDILKNHKLVGADIVELSPQLDFSGISSILAAKTTRSLIMLLSK